ncbi:hypothetical protein IU500_00100 [Nocardia terpenica]|uniref:VOC family protein n=1 Tax=Nocardia terpenica TaxID=455432 RepID=UPI001895FFA7|nr:VOC family protein [Nocardia terpenica]MBF6060022.1 hypothetical protein [Nocardia terpenica]MBF6102437.1 hypothetical protein [Nocardia terpenica]MBF6111372.1 hypothetical protein [Nocardia terpenica]MBF6117503.1 hypothetical protein [Nocardia terpenica]MBF6150656.1 hypothetical protein [Nocardia terpenica]
MGASRPRVRATALALDLFRHRRGSGTGSTPEGRSSLTKLLLPHTRARGEGGREWVHLDVRVGTGLVGEERLAVLEAECARPVVFGAVRVRVLPADGGNESCLVMRDIEGNEFCLD